MCVKTSENVDRDWILCLFYRKIALGSVFMGVCAVFGLNFREKKAVRSSRLVLGFWSHGPTGLKMGSVWMSLPVWRELKPVKKYHLSQGKKVWMSLPVWRELKLCGHIITISAMRIVWMSLPVWRELKRKRVTSASATKSEGLNEPSRLKGIETRCFYPGRVKHFCLNEPSRLKGIETLKKWEDALYHRYPQVWMSLPVWRELKLNSCPSTSIGRISLNEPSRLKGIETCRPWACRSLLGWPVSEWAFPFEGNWNLASL